MTFIIVSVFLLLFFGGCIVAVVFAARRYGWIPVLRYGLVAILIRVLMRGFMSDAGQTQTIAVPLLGAALVAWLWPHVAKQRMREKNEEVESNPDDKDR
jgi:hypothetical protein